MSKNELRYSISPEQYLERNYVMIYIEDAVSQLLELRDDSAKVNASKFFAAYFGSVKEGSHVLLREFSFIRATPHNRASFVHMCWKTFSNIARKIDLMNMYEYHSLLCLICPDLPMSIVQQTARIVLVDDSLDCLMSFADFIYAFQLRLCYDEFLTKCGEAYKALVQNRPSSLETVVVPTSEGRPCSASVAHGNSGGYSNNEGVDSMLFHRSLVGICEKLDNALPPDILKSVLTTAPRMSFYGFLNSLAKSTAVNEHIGKLPPRSELLTTFEPEMMSNMPSPPPPPPASNLLLQPNESVVPGNHLEFVRSHTTTTTAKPTNGIEQMRRPSSSSSAAAATYPVSGSSTNTLLTSPVGVGPLSTLTCSTTPVVTSGTRPSSQRRSAVAAAVVNANKSDQYRPPPPSDSADDDDDDDDTDDDDDDDDTLSPT